MGSRRSNRTSGGGVPRGRRRWRSGVPGRKRSSAAIDVYRRTRNSDGSTTRFGVAPVQRHRPFELSRTSCRPLSAERDRGSWRRGQAARRSGSEAKLQRNPKGSRGGGGIRTHGEFPHTRFPSVPNRPLSHPSWVTADQGILAPTRPGAWRSGPVRRWPVNRVRAGRQQLSAEPAGCRRSPDRHTRGRVARVQRGGWARLDDGRQPRLLGRRDPTRPARGVSRLGVGRNGDGERSEGGDHVAADHRPTAFVHGPDGTEAV